MKKYRVTKEHPYIKEGIELEELHCTIESLEKGILKHDLVKDIVQNHPTWFEEIDSRWKPKNGENFFYVSDVASIYSSTWSGDWEDVRRYDMGNIFRSKKEAEQARDKVKELLLSLHKDTN